VEGSGGGDEVGGGEEAEVRGHGCRRLRSRRLEPVHLSAGLVPPCAVLLRIVWREGTRATNGRGCCCSWPAWVSKVQKNRPTLRSTCTFLATATMKKARPLMSPTRNRSASQIGKLQSYSQLIWSHSKITIGNQTGRSRDQNLQEALIHSSRNK
jgi:hypothetical protein